MSAVHTPETIASIVRLAGLGWSGSQIAAEMGGMTRNAVIGIASRNKIQLHGTRPRCDAPPKRHRVRYKPMAIHKPVCEPIAEEPPPANPVTFAELQPDHCRFPYGDRDFTFCGGKRIEGRPYCGFHCARCFYPR